MSDTNESHEGRIEWIWTYMLFMQAPTVDDAKLCFIRGDFDLPTFEGHVARLLRIDTATAKGKA